MSSQASATSALDASYFEHAPSGLLVADTKGAILRVNGALCEWLDWSEQDLIDGRRVQDLLSVGGRLFFQTHCGPLLAMQGSVAEVQLEILTRHRKRLPVLINIVRHASHSGPLDIWSLVVTTERRAYESELLNERRKAEASVDARLQAEAQLQDANAQLSAEHRRKDEFLATLAHELRNPLAPLRNVLEVIRRNQASGSPAPWGMDIVERQTRQLTRLVDDLMDVSRITQGRMQLRKTPCELVAIVRAAIADLSDMVGKAQHRLVLQAPERAVLVDADEVRLTQVIGNLLTNAVKYTPDGGHIAVRVCVSGQAVAVSISDSGIGMPPSALLSIFDMFSQLTPALERSQGGLGIGLALVRGLVELHGGRIDADSAGVGQGSVFTVTLPLLQEATSAAAPALPAAPATPSRVLVVDDNTDAADTLAMALELLGHEVRVAYRGSDALTEAEQFAPALILLDIGLPDINGYEVARRIRATDWGRRTVLVAATGWSQDADRQRASDAGFDRHLVKPIDFERLQEVIGAL
ncbi:MAG: ATP-binding protein [Pseudomonadota bacterium]